MNKVYLSGEICDAPELVNRPDADTHCIFPLQVNHLSKKGLRKELYRINAWNNCADYCVANLQKGMRVVLQGYLTQHKIQIGNMFYDATEVTIGEVVIPSGQPVASLADVNESDLEACTFTN